MPVSTPLVVYGSYGYTGALIVDEALSAGLRPVLAGRNAEKLARQAEQTGLDHRAFALDDPAAVDAGLAGMRAVIHCAGPFAHTAAAMAEGCLRGGLHYTDVTGEISVFEDMAARDERARAAGVMLMPGVGFDVVPSDCLAVHLKSRLPAANRLTLAFYSAGRSSHGTSATIVENFPHGGMIRRDGQLTPVPAAWKQLDLTVDGKTYKAITIPWGDVSTAYHSTGIPNIEVYMAAPPGLIAGAKASNYLGPVLGAGPVQRFLKSRIPEGGPDAEERARGFCHLWGEVRDEGGETVSATLRTPESYTLTAQAAVRIAHKILDGNAPAGFQTPAKAYGPGLILEIEGTERN